jgi:hypothetical protein
VAERPAFALANLLGTQGRLSEAESVVEGLLSADPRNAKAFQYLLKLAAGRHDDERLLELCNRREGVLPPTPNTVVSKTKALKHLSRFAEAKDYLLKHQALWETSDALASTVGSLPWSEAEQVQVASAILRIGLSPAVPTPIRLTCIIVMATLGRDQEAMQILLDKRSANAFASNSLVRAIFKDGPIAPVAEMPVFDSAVTVAHKRGARKVLFVFSGLADQLQLPLPIFHRLVAPLDAHIVYLRDFDRTLYLLGMSELGADLPSTISALRDLVASIGGEEIFTFGNSAGGFAAVRYGIDLGAKAVLVSGGPTNLEREFMARDGRGAVVIKRVNSEVKKEDLNLRTILLRASHRPQIYSYFCAGHPQDAAHAQNLAGLEGVHIRPVMGCDAHGVIGPMILRNTFLPTVAELMGLAAP